MKHVLNLCLLLLMYSANAQKGEIFVDGKSTLHYKADLITNEMLENYPSFGEEKYIFNKVLGIEVQIKIDTVFKRYYIGFKNNEGKEEAFILNYVRDYFPDNGSSKIYLMESQGAYFMVSNFISQFDYLDIIYEKKVKDIYTLRHAIKNIKRVVDTK